MIRKALKSDIHDVYRLLCILENQDLNYPYFCQKYQNALENQDIYYHVKVVDEKVVGFISLYIKRYLHHCHDTGEIVELIVDPQMRNLSIGTELISYIEEFAVDKGLEELELSTSTYRKKAHHFYEMHGFVRDHYNYTKKFK